jgi:hypothetical protein
MGRGEPGLLPAGLFPLLPRATRGGLAQPPAGLVPAPVLPRPPAPPASTLGAASPAPPASPAGRSSPEEEEEERGRPAGPLGPPSSLARLRLCSSCGAHTPPPAGGQGQEEQRRQWAGGRRGPVEGGPHARTGSMDACCAPHTAQAHQAAVNPPPPPGFLLPPPHTLKLLAPPASPPCPGARPPPASSSGGSPRCAYSARARTPRSATAGQGAGRVGGPPMDVDVVPAGPPASLSGRDSQPAAYAQPLDGGVGWG